MSYTTSSLYNTLFNIKPVMLGGGLTPEKRIFLFKTFLNLIIQLAITYFVMTKTHLSIPNWILFVSILLVVIIISLVPMHPLLKFLLFSIFSILIGILLSTGIHGIDKSTVQFAILGTSCIFISMIITALILLALGIELGFYTFIFLFFGLLIGLLFSILQFVISINQVWLSNSLILLFSVFIIYDTQQILNRNYYGDFITASLDYYLDIINIFIRLLKTR